MNCEGILEEIENRCENVTYISETDAEVHAFQSPHNVRGTFNKASFLTSLGLPPLTPIEERDFEAVLANQAAQNTAWEPLKTYLEDNLTSLKVFAVGEIQVDIYAVGLFTDNEIIGIKTNATET